MVKKYNKKNSRKSESEGFKIFKHPINNIDKDILKEALLAKAKADKESFPTLLDSFMSHLRNYYPPAIIATIAAYGMQFVGNHGVLSKAMAPQVHQHHIEIIMAMALTIPYSEWGSKPPVPEVIQQIINQIKELAEAFIFRRYNAFIEEHDAQQRTLLFLQERLREHTQVVRNWGYFSAVIRISKELYSHCDQKLLEYFGFCATDLIDVSETLVSVLEKKATKRFNILKEIFHSSTIKQMVRNYCAKFPDVDGDPEAYILTIPDGVTKEMVKFILLAHADISLVKLGLVDVDEISKLTGRTKPTIESILNKLSRYPGSLDASMIEQFFLDNPIWTTPGIKLSDQYFFPAPQIIFSNIHAIMKLLVTEAGIKKELEKQRAVFLETKVKETVESALPGIRLTPNVKWALDGNIYETDLLGIIDRVVLIVESKSAALTPQGLRGAPDRVKRHVHELIVEPASQSYRLERIIVQAKEKEPVSLEIVSSLGLNPDNIDIVIRVSVTLDDFSVLCSYEQEFKKLGWVNEDLRLATTLNIADFEIIADILDEPSYFLHYFAERARMQKSTHIFGDELDYLSLYLETGFNIFPHEKDGMSLEITGMSQSIDHYYSSRDARIVIRKPKLKIHPRLAGIIRMVYERNVIAWTTISLDLLRIGTINEQKLIFSKIDALRESVSKYYQDPKHLCSIVVSPSPSREACVIFYVYPDAISSQRHDAVRMLSGEIFSENNYKRCTIVGKKVEEWDIPYQFIGISLPL